MTAAVPAAVPAAKDALPRLIKTQAAYRRLLQDGCNGQEAAGLISYVVGLAPCASRWSLGQVNRMLFLRDLYRNSEWGRSEQNPE